VRVLHLERKGRGRALRAAWSASEADVVAYMDVDLSTDLAALPELLRPLLERQADLAVGSRLAPGANVTRGIKREVISRGYNVLLHTLLGAGFSDAQCGFKAGRRETIQRLLEEVENDAWFFDTELLYCAQRSRLTIHEVPVRWVDDPDSRVAIIATAREDIRGVMRLRRLTRQRERQAGAEATAGPWREAQR
jgi:glycosyltransferase involved in cell wall biosynthesis